MGLWWCFEKFVELGGSCGWGERGREERGEEEIREGFDVTFPSLFWQINFIEWLRKRDK